jgi:hypothetical protein
MLRQSAALAQQSSSRLCTRQGKRPVLSFVALQPLQLHLCHARGCFVNNRYDVVFSAAADTFTMYNLQNNATRHLAFETFACSRTCATSWGFFSKKPHASLIFDSSRDSTDGSPQCTWQQQHDHLANQVSPHWAA